MQKRGRAVETQKLRRAMKGRRTIDMRESNSVSMAYIRLTIAWFCIVGADFLFGFRFELLWPFWMLVRSFYESFQRQNVFVHQLGGHTSTVLFVCVTATSDLICYLFIPVRLLIFVATTYVWMTLVWHVNGGFLRTIATMFGDRSQAIPIVVLWAFFLFFEVFCRIRCDHLVFLRNTPLMYYFPDSDGTSCLQMQGLNPPIQRGVNAFLGAHCIGYPLIVISFNLKYYYKEWRLRRKQDCVGRRNEVLNKLLTEALPAIYEGPTDWRKCQYLDDEKCLDDDLLVPIDHPQLLPPPQSSSSPLLANGNVRKTSLRGSTTSSRRQNHKNGPSRVKTVNALGMEERREDEDDDGTDEWNDDSSLQYGDDSSSASSAPSVIRLIFAAISRVLDGVVWISEAVRSLLLSPLISEGNEEGEEREENRSNVSKRTRTTVNTNGVQQGRVRSGGKEGISNGWSHSVDTPHRGNGCAKLDIRDASRESNGRMGEDAKQRICGEECAKSAAECIRLRSELRAIRSAEEAARLQAANCSNSEKMARAECGQMKTRMEQLLAKVNSVERQAEQERATAGVAERKAAEASSRQIELEKELREERRARKEEKANGVHKAESQSDAQLTLIAKERAWEKEAERMRKDSSTKDGIIVELTSEVKKLRSAVKQTQDSEELRLELKLLQEKNEHLETSLAAENKLKQELFRALRNSSGQTSIQKGSTAVTPPPMGMISSHPPPAYNDDFISSVGSGGAPGRPAYSFASPISLPLSSPSGEHTLFDPAPSFPNGSSHFGTTCASLATDSDLFYADRMGKFGAPSPANSSARTN